MPTEVRVQRTRLDPPVSEKLLLELEARYPDRCPDDKDSERQVWIKVGQALVVRHLRQLFNQFAGATAKEDAEATHV